MRILMIAVLGLGLCSVARAQGAKITVAGNEQLRPMVQKIAESLNAPLSEWNIVIVKEPRWASLTRTVHTNTAFSLVASNVTYIREQYLITNKSKRIEITLAHEAGHLVCRCEDENRADSTGLTLLHP